jgi:hypothetical protein
MEYLKVEGHTDLFRDAISGAIVNKNSSEYESYIKSYNARKTQSSRLERVETDLTDLKNEISELKDLLKQYLIK